MKYKVGDYVTIEGNEWIYDQPDEIHQITKVDEDDDAYPYYGESESSEEWLAEEDIRLVDDRLGVRPVLEVFAFDSKLEPAHVAATVPTLGNGDVSTQLR